MYSGKVVWITGASSGIGEALALEFARAGANLILSSRNLDKLNGVRDSCNAAAGPGTGIKILVLPMDVTDEASLPEKTQQANAFLGSIDLLINNAGISQRSVCLETDMSTYRSLFEVDVFGQIALTKQVLPIMVEQGSGHIAITSSVAGKMGVPFRTGYSAAKHAVMGFFDALRTEVAHHNIQVTTITPGFIRTAISENALRGDGTTFGKVDQDIRGGISASECAQTILKGIRSGKSEIAVGRGIEMHALWIKRFFPKILFKMLEKEYRNRANDREFE